LERERLKRKRLRREKLRRKRLKRKIINFGVSNRRKRIDKNLLLKLRDKNKFMLVNRNKFVSAKGNKYKFVNKKRKKPKINLKLKFKLRKFFKHFLRRLKKVKVKLISLFKVRIRKRIKFNFLNMMEKARSNINKQFPKVRRIKNVNLKILSILKIQLLRILKGKIRVSNPPNFAKVKSQILLVTGPKKLEHIEKCLMENEAELKVKDKMNIYAYFSEIS